MLNLGIPIEFGPVAGGGGGSKWYAPRTGAPTILPVASGFDALAAGNTASATDVRAIAFGTSAQCSRPDGIAIAFQANCQSQNGVAIGRGTQAGTILNDNAVAVGPFILGGGANSASLGSGNNGSGANCVSIGTSTIASSTNSIAIGNTTTSTGNAGVAIGYTAVVSNTRGVGIAEGATVSAESAVAIGAYAVASHTNAFASGQLATSLNANEMTRRCSSGAAVRGRMQSIQLDATTTTGAATNLTGIAIADNTAAAFHGRLAAFRTVTTGGGVVGDSAGWDINGTVKQVAGVYALVGAVIVGVAGAPNFNDAGAAGWVLACAIIANRLTFTVTGQAGETIEWTASIEFASTN